MIYLPSGSFRWWTAPTDDIRQTTFHEYLAINAYQFERAMYELIPLEDRVYEALGYRDLSQRELVYVTSAYWQDMGVRPNCTMTTALRRLMRQGKITRKLQSRGWFQWYVYSRVE